MNKLLLFLLLLPFGVSAQLIQKNTTYGMAFNRTGADTLFYLPVDTFSVPTVYRTYNFMARKATTLYIWNTSTFAWQAVSSGGGSTDTTSLSNRINRKWDRSGDAGTTPGTDFIGTTDSASLFFKLNGSKWGSFDINQKNLSFGYLALNSVTSTGLRNTVFGSLAGQSLTTSDDNVAIGYSALRQQTAFTKNTAVGAYALDSSISAGGTVSIGYASLQSLSGGTGNTAVGSFALNKLISNINTAIGYEAAMNTTTNNNTVIGYRALKDNVNANETTVVGSQAMINATGGTANSAFGVSALSKTEQGLNTAIGYGSMLNNTAGDQNSAVGYYSLLNNTTGAKNSAFGAGALENNTTGSFNTAVGQDAMLNNTSGFRNIGVGWNAKFGDSSYNNIGIGYAVGSSLTGGGNHDNTFIGGFGTANNINQKVQPIHQIVIGSYAYGTRDYETVIGSDSSKYIKFYAADSAQWVGLDRTTSYSHVLAYDSATGNTRYMPTSSIGSGSGVTTLAAFGAGARLPGDTAAFTDSTIYGSFYNDGEDTLVITAMRIVMQGTNDTLTINVEWNDSLNTTGTKLKTAYAAANNNYTGNTYTSFDNTKIPPGNHVWCKSPTVIPGRRPTYLSVTLIGYKKRV